MVQKERDTGNQKEPEAKILHKWCYKILTQADLAQVVEKDPDTELLHKWSCRNLGRTLIQVAEKKI